MVHTTATLSHNARALNDGTGWIPAATHVVAPAQELPLAAAGALLLKPAYVQPAYAQLGSQEEHNGHGVKPPREEGQGTEARGNGEQEVVAIVSRSSSSASCRTWTSRPSSRPTRQFSSPALPTVLSPS